MNNYNVCVARATHGNENDLGQLVHDYLDIQIPNQYHKLVSNPKAIELNQRFVHSDLNRSFDGSGLGYEAERAEEIKALFDAEEFTHVVDIHTSPTTDSIIGVVPGECDSSATNLLIAAMPLMENVVMFKEESNPSSLVGAFGHGGIGIECPRYDLKVHAEIIGQSIVALLKGGAIQEPSRKLLYLIDGYVPLDVHIPGGSLRDFEEIPEIGGYGFVVCDIYKKSGFNHQGMRASSRREVSY